jgi:hypothetical protein
MFKKAIPAMLVGLVLLTCADEARRATGRVMTDAGTMLLGMDASAQQDGATPGGDRRVVTADTDLSRLETGIVTAGRAGVQLVRGPIVITDLSSEDSISFWIAAERDGCATTQVTAGTGADQSLAGARIVVRADQVFCARGDAGAGMLWSGFRPYE